MYTKVNKALETLGGKWSRNDKGHVFPADPRPQVEGLLSNGTLTIAVDGFFETPKAVVEKMIEIVPLAGGDANYLEPSCGLGAIMRVLVDHGVWKDWLDGFEQNGDRVEQLQTEGFSVAQGDFLAIPIKPEYDRIYMNPPFERGQDVDHFRQAFKALKPGGKMISVMSAGVTFRDDAKTTAFRNWLRNIGGMTYRLPEGSFASSGTGVNTVLVTAKK